MATSTANRIDRKQLISILPGLSKHGLFNICSQNCIANFVADMFVAGRLSKEAEDNLCRMVSQAYSNTIKFNRERLLTFLGNTSVSWQSALGKIFFEFSKRKMPKAFDPDNRADWTAFLPLAEEFSFGVNFYVDSRVDTSQQKVIKSSDAIPSIHPTAKLQLNVHYDGGHYSRIAKDVAEAHRHNSNEPVHPAVVMQPPKPSALPVPKRSTHAAIMKQFKALNADAMAQWDRSKRYLREQKLAELEKTLQVKVRPGQSGVRYHVGETETVYVSQKAQIELDKQLATSLAAEEYQEHQQTDESRNDQTPKLKR